MIRHIRGKYLFYEKGSVIIETPGGIGIRVFVPDTSPLLYSAEGDTVQLYTYLQVKDDGLALYGFPDRESLDLFEQLLTVSSVGPKAGLAIMSLGTPNQIKLHIAHKDARAIARAQGIGKKTAERVILELCDKVNPLPSADEEGGTDVVSALLTEERGSAVVALTTLGYSKAEAEDAIGRVTEEGLTAEEYIRKALQFLL